MVTLYVEESDKASLLTHRSKLRTERPRRSGYGATHFAQMSSPLRTIPTAFVVFPFLQSFLRIAWEIDRNSTASFILHIFLEKAYFYNE
jgi:hypothetical protein